jgi:hypothetical protein
MDSLRGRLLIASPVLVDPNFHRTVVLIMEHSEEGALGVVLNRPTELAVGEAVPDLAELADGDPVFAGGPVQPQAVIALAEHTGPVGDESVCGPIAPIQVSDDIEDASGHVARVRVSRLRRMGRGAARRRARRGGLVHRAGAARRHLCRRHRRPRRRVLEARAASSRWWHGCCLTSLN